MVWIQLISLFLANLGMILWFRTESRNDWMHMNNKIGALHCAHRNEMKEFREIWMQESKEFHAQLCEIEERKINDKSQQK